MMWCLLVSVPQQVNKVTKLVAEESCPFVGESLRQVKEAVGNTAAVLGFVGAPFTLATYIVEVSLQALAACFECAPWVCKLDVRQGCQIHC